MSRRPPAVVLAWVLGPALALAAGCAGLGLPGPTLPDLHLPKLSALKSPAEDISQKRRQRSQAALERLQRNRDFAEYQTALFCQQQGDDQAALRGLRKLLERNPDHRESRLLLADLLLEQNAPAEAVKNVQYVLDKNPSDAGAHHALALLLDATGDEAGAREHYEKAATLEPDNEIYQVSLRTALAAVQSPEGELAAAPAPPVPSAAPVASVASEASASAPQPAPGERLAVRRTIARQLAELSAGSPGQAESLAQEPDPRVATTTPEPPAPAQRPTPEPLALAQRPTPEPPGLPRRSETRGDKPRGSLVAAPAQATTDRGDRAEKAGFESHAQTAGRVEPASGVAAAPDARPASASPFGAAGWELGNAHPAAELMEMGNREMSAGNTATAVAYFRKAMAASPDNPHLPTTAATAALRQNQPAAAVELLQDAVRAFPRSASRYQLLATAYYRQGDYGSSQVAAQQALSLDNTSALSYFLVGSALVRLGQPEAAEAHLRQARRLDPRFGAAR